MLVSCYIYITYQYIYIYMQYIICFSWFPHDACGWIESKPTGSPGSVSAFSEKNTGRLWAVMRWASSL